jgi:hypothetical protein
MFYVICPLCHVGIEIPSKGVLGEFGPDCRESQNVVDCYGCGEAFYFDSREVIEEKDRFLTAWGAMPPGFCIAVFVTFIILNAFYGDTAMFYVICPVCKSRVEIPDDAVGPERTDLFNVAFCFDCSTGFDYDDEEVHPESEPPRPGSAH